MKYIAVKHNPIAIWIKYACQWFLANGIQFCAAHSIIPPPKLPDTPKANSAAAKVAAKIACTTNSIGATNKNVNSKGSVIPANIAVKVAGINKPATIFFFIWLSCHI